MNTYYNDENLFPSSEDCPTSNSSSLTHPPVKLELECCEKSHPNSDPMTCVSVKYSKSQCPECGKYLANVNEHIKLVHLKIKNNCCTQCPYKTCFKSDLKKHIKAVHGEVPKFETTDFYDSSIQSGFEPFCEVGQGRRFTDPKKSTPCPLCGKYIVNVREHVKNVHGKEKNYFCSLCTYETMFKADLLKHDELVHKKMKKACPDCGKQVANLPEHIRLVHKKEKNFKCNFCAYSCAKQSDMKKHSKNVHKAII